MNFTYSHLIPENLHATSRVWVYQSSRLFTLTEALQIEDMLASFVDAWQSHGNEVTGYGNLLFGQFIVFIADETHSGVSGCSTDSSVRLIKTIEQTFKVDMFDRQTLAFVVKDKIQLLPLSQLNYALENAFINLDTIYFNNLVATKQELLNKWMIPLKDSWLMKKVKTTSTNL